MKLKKGDYSKLIILLIVILNVLFTIGVLTVFWHTSAEPTILVGAWFAFTMTDLICLAGIKKQKIRKERRTEESINE